MSERHRCTAWALKKGRLTKEGQYLQGTQRGLDQADTPDQLRCQKDTECGTIQQRHGPQYHFRQVRAPMRYDYAINSDELPCHASAKVQTVCLTSMPCGVRCIRRLDTVENKPRYNLAGASWNIVLLKVASASAWIACDPLYVGLALTP